MSPVDPAPRRTGDEPGSPADHDPVLRAMLLDLAAALGAPARPAVSPGAEPQRIGRFQIEGRIGEGGGGVVYRAQDPVLGRVVALKIARSGLLWDAEARQRFQDEARVAASLDHPSIIPVHDFGEVDGVHYIVYAYCPGQSLSEWLRDRSEPVPSRLAAELVLRLAGAMQHSHDRGVLHRDLKPGNVLLQPGEPGAGESLPFLPRITDFGLSRRFQDDPATDPTRSLTLLGTPPYMAPEQAGGGHRKVGPWTDVHGLGAILYAILTARPPFLGTTWQETLRQVLEEDPPPPRLIRPDLERDLESIGLMCLRKDPTRRYPGAAALAEDLQRFLDGVPVIARPESPWETSRRWARRHPARAVALGAAAGFLVLAIVSLIALNSWLHETNRRLAVAKQAADRNTQLATRYRFGAEMGLARDALESGQIERAQEILDAMTTRPQAAGESGSAGESEANSEFADLATDNIAWRLLRQRARRELIVVQAHETGPIEMQLSADRRSLVSIDAVGLALIWDVDRSPPRLRARVPVPVTPNATFSADGAFLLAVRLEPRRGLILDAATGSLIREIPPLGPQQTFSSWVSDPSPSAWMFLASEPEAQTTGLTPYQFLDLAQADHPLRQVPGIPRFPNGHETTNGRLTLVWHDDRLDAHDAITGEARWSIPVAPGGTSLPRAWWIGRRHDGRELVADWSASQLRLLDASDGKVLERMPIGRLPFNRLLLTPDGRTLLISRGDHGRIDLVNLAPRSDPTPLRPPSLRTGDIRTMVVSPDAQHLACLAIDRESRRAGIEVWHLPSRSRVRTFPGRLDVEASLAFIDGGRSLLVSGRGPLRDVRIAPRVEAPLTLRDRPDEIWEVAFSPDGRTLALGTDDQTPGPTVQIRDTPRGQLRVGWRDHPATVCALAFTPDGRGLVSAGLATESNLVIREPRTGRLVARLPDVPVRLRTLALDRRGQTLAVAGDPPEIELIDLPSRRARIRLAGHEARVHRVAFSPTADLLASASDDRTVRLWDPRSGRRLGRFPFPQSAIALAFSPDGLTLAVTQRVGTITLLRVPEGRWLRQIQVEGPLSKALSFSPDGRCLAAGGETGLIHLFDPVTGHELLTLDGPDTRVNALAFSPDGLTLAAGSHDGTLRIWQAGESAPVLDRVGSGARKPGLPDRGRGGMIPGAPAAPLRPGEEPG